MRASITRALRAYGMQLSILAGATVVLVIISPAFRGQAAVFTVFNSFPLVGLVALGVSVTIIAGELDLSAASCAAFSGVIAVHVATATGSLAVTLLAVTAIGVVIGLVQGWIIARFRINSMVITVASLTLLQGLAYIASNEQPVTLSNYAMTDPLFIRWAGVLSPATVLVLALFAVVGLYLAKMRWGRETYAVGGGRAEAFAAGVPQKAPVIRAFVISAACAALAGGLAAMQSSSATANDYASLLLASVSAALVGGVSVYGGHGNVVNVILGVAILGEVTAALSAGGFAEYVTQLIVGVLLFVVVGSEYMSIRISTYVLHRRIARTVGGSPLADPTR